jgi:P-type Ca2+ transporter type 2C
MTTPVIIPSAPKNKFWHRQSTEEVLATLHSTANGLSAEEAAQRLAANGPNELKEGKRIKPWEVFLAQFKSLLIWILISAALISGFLGEWIDCFAILAIVILNAFIGFYQEFKAEQSIAALKKLTAPQAKVRRNGAITILPASQIVLGDIIELEAGDCVAADARLLESSDLKTIEAPLTGESDAVPKEPDVLHRDDIPLGDRTNMVFMGTSVATGIAQAVVVETGMNTEIGHIAHLLAETSEDQATPLQEKLTDLGRILVWIALAIVAVIFLLGLLRGTAFVEGFMTAVSLAVAAVPEGLPAVVTVALALGVMRMSRRRALVRKLPSVETLGSTNVICTDKTGTLTVGEMTVRELYVSGHTFEVSGEGYSPEGEVLFEGKKFDARFAAPLLELATVLTASNNARLVREDRGWRVIGDPTEGAMLAAGHKAGVRRDQLESTLPRRHEIPFDSDRKRRTVIRLMPDGASRAFVNGAPDVLLDMCSRVYTREGVQPLTDGLRHQIIARNSAMAHRSLRVLGSAYRDLGKVTKHDFPGGEVEHDLVFVGLAGMHDPPRQEAREAVQRCRSAGIRVVMITGDHPHTALAIARELGIASPDDLAISGVALDKLSDHDLKERASQIAVYARVTAEHKFRIVSAWKANGAVVAMTGDGVNDAPAIKGADIGIAMGKSGTEVTKQASDMIITDDNFASIVAAVEEGRGIYDNIRKTLQYLLAGNTGELVLIVTCVIVGLPSPLLPIHLLWINLMTDGLPALCLAIDPIDPDVMKRQPRVRGEKIMNRSFLSTLSITGLLTAGVAFIVFLYGLKNHTIEIARSYAFAALVFAELFRSFGCRSETRPLWKIPILTNIILFVVVVASFGLQFIIQQNALLGRLLKTSKLDLSDCFLLITLSLIPAAVIELRKLWRSWAAKRSPLLLVYTD